MSAIFCFCSQDLPDLKDDSKGGDIEILDSDKETKNEFAKISNVCNVIIISLLGECPDRSDIVKILQNTVNGLTLIYTVIGCISENPFFTKVCDSWLWCRFWKPKQIRNYCEKIIMAKTL